MLARAGSGLVIDGNAIATVSEPGVLTSIFGWPLLLWTIRVGLFIVFVAAIAVFLLLVARFFRFKHIRAMVSAPLPQFKEVGGKFAGVEATAKLLEADAATAQQLDAVNKRIDDLVEYIGKIAALVAETDAGSGEVNEQA